jgi:hypothetical protein
MQGLNTSRRNLSPACQSEYEEHGFAPVIEENAMAKDGRRGGTKPAPVNEEPPGELDFNKGDERSGRAGDPRSQRDYHGEFPEERVRKAGMTGGENPGGEVTADDLAPETLLDEDRSRTPEAQEGRAAIDSVLRDAAEAEIGEGHGKDEAELAREEGNPGEAGGELKQRRKAARDDKRGR